MDNDENNWEIGISSSSSSEGTTCLPPPCGGSCVDVVAEEGEEEYDDDDYHDDEDDDDYEEKSGLACPFCADDFDVLGLCCHIDVDHHKEAKAAVCPVCVTKVETNMAVHLITQHETILKILCKKKFRNGEWYSALSPLKKELKDKHLHPSLKGSSFVNSSSDVERDSLLLSFFNNPQPCLKPQIASLSTESSLSRINSRDSNLESRDIKMSALPDKDEEKAQRCEFLQGLLLSTIFSYDF